MARGSQECVQVLQAFTGELSLGLARVLGADQSSGIHSQLEMAARHETVPRILWRAIVRRLYTGILQMHNSPQSFVCCREPGCLPAFLCPQFGLIRA